MQNESVDGKGDKIDELVDDKTRRRELTSLPLADDAFLLEVLTPFENPGGSEKNRGRRSQ